MRRNVSFHIFLIPSLRLVLAHQPDAALRNAAPTYSCAMKNQQSPAMPNGRCRMHGGKSPGAPKGNRNAWKHGLYSAEAIALRRLIRRLLSDAADLVERC